MIRRLTVSALLIALVTAGGIARAVTPFGDEPGFIPPDAANLKYETRVGKNLGKFQACVIKKCHAQRASGRLPNDSAEDTCEAGCKTKYDRANARLIAPPPASTCLNTDALRQLWEGILDSFNNKIYCAGTVGFGTDDTGFVPPDPVTGKCERRVGANAAKLLKCQAKCHANRASQKLADDTAEDGCETTCGGKFDTANAGLTGCPTCLGATGLADLKSTMLSQGDNFNDQVYCAQ